MNDAVEHSFDHLPKSPRGHFVLYFYTAVFHLLNHIQLLSHAGGPTLEETFKRYPFLSEYYNEMLNYMPNDINWVDATNWWSRAIISWEKKCDARLPIRLLEDCASLDFENRLAFIAIGLVEEDSRFGTLFEELQAPLSQRRPTLEFISQMIFVGREQGVNNDAWNLCRPLIDMGFIEVLNDQAPRSEWFVRVPPLLWDAARGEVIERPAAWCRFHHLQQFPDIGELVFPDDMLDRLRNIPQLIAQSKMKGGKPWPLIDD